jgi:hypothetical protein
VCFDLSISNLGAGTVTAAHIHRGKAKRRGPVVVALGDGISLDPLNHHDRASLCVNGVAKKTIRAILRAPANYYANVHTTVWPGGAARGQLKRTS